MADTGVFPDETSIFIVAAGTRGSDLTDADKVAGEITNWSLSGLEQDIESIPVIGGFVDKESPRSQGELSFDVIVSNIATSTLDRWDTYKFGVLGDSTGSAINKAVFISSNSGGKWKTIAINNAKVTTFEPEMAADDMLRSSVTLKFSPETSLGAANLKSSALSYSIAPFFNW